MKYLYLVLAIICFGLFQNCSKSSESFSSMDSKLNSITSAGGGGVTSSDIPDGSVVDGGSSGDPSPGPEELNYVCILDGPGKSQKLAFNDNVLAGQTAVPKVVCTTQNGCSNIASQKFTVKDIVLRGYCTGNNPNVVHVSEEVLQTLVDAVK